MPGAKPEGSIELNGLFAAYVLRVYSTHQSDRIRLDESAVSRLQLLAPMEIKPPPAWETSYWPPNVKVLGRISLA